MPVLPRRSTRSDGAVSAVIGVILMVAITVAIAATVYIYVGGFGTNEGGVEDASATARAINTDTGDKKTDWIRVILASGEGAPYTGDQVNAEIIVPGGTVYGALCETPTFATATAPTPKCADPFDEAAETWEVGTSKFFPCDASGDHSVTVAIRETTILDRTVECDEAAN